MTVAWLFPGQDAFTPELGLSLRADPLGARLLARVEAATGADVSTDASRRRAGTFDTAVIQPLLAAVGLALAARHQPRPDVVAGASLGALLAFAVATDQDPERVVDAACVRGRAMAACARAHPGGMIVVATTDLDEALTRGRAAGVLDPAAHNAPGQWILAGDAAALRAVGALGRRVPVTGPWHCARMADAEPAVRDAVAALSPRELGCAWIVDGERVASAADGRRSLVDQLTRPVHWWDTLRRLRADGVDDVWVLGPGRVLRTQVREAMGLLAREAA